MHVFSWKSLRRPNKNGRKNLRDNNELDQLVCSLAHTNVDSFSFNDFSGTSVDAYQYASNGISTFRTSSSVSTSTNVWIRWSSSDVSIMFQFALSHAKS
jgi:hypothetical protein